MIDYKHKKWVFSFFMSLFMSCIMSLVISLYNVGFVEDILSIWLNGFFVAAVVAFPTILLVSPFVEKASAIVLRKASA